VTDLDEELFGAPEPVVVDEPAVEEPIVEEVEETVVE
jgi:hypothetical protein